MKNRENKTQIKELQRSITVEAGRAAGFQPGSWQERLFSLFFWFPAHRFASLSAQFEQDVRQFGLTQAADHLCSQFFNEIQVLGEKNVPPEGPLLIASNHPGAFDGLVIISKVRRDDLKLIISDVPFTRGLSATAWHLIYSTGNNMQERMTAVRQSLRHLRNHGSLLVFPTGLVDPDPAFMSGAEETFQAWSTSLAYFFNKIPGITILPTIVSGVLAPGYLNHPLARMQSTVRQRQKVAEYLEIAQMMVFKKKTDLRPCISFGEPLSSTEIAPALPPPQIEKIIQERALKLFDQHRCMFYDHKFHSD